MERLPLNSERNAFILSTSLTNRMLSSGAPPPPGPVGPLPRNPGFGVRVILAQLNGTYNYTADVRDEWRAAVSSEQCARNISG